MVLSSCTNSMDPSLYNTQGNFNQKMADAHQMRRNLTLNLENSDTNNRRLKCTNNYNAVIVNSPAPLLSSPDVNKFKLSTSDIMKFFPGINAKTPTPITPSLLARSLNDDYSQTLESLTSAQYEQNSLQVDPLKSDVNDNHSVSDPLSTDFINIENQYPATLSSVNMIIPHENVAVKEEPQTISSLGSSPRLSPINMDTQEAIKLERKRSRNRLAASKCRKRKLERIAKLEEKVKLLKGENNELNQHLSRLKAQVYNLKLKVVKHHNNGCLIGHS